MAFIIKFAKGVRNHWKKSIFAAIALSYGFNYAKEYYEIQQLMRVYCQEAVKYGKLPIKANENPRHITIILNPNANKRKAMKDYEKYCAPILNLGGVFVDVIQTDAEGHAKTLMENLQPTNAIVVAGGDGTLSEVVTGLMRKSKSNKIELPIGILPLGKSNTIAKTLFPGGTHLQTVRLLADASLAVIEERTKLMDVMKIEVLEDEDLQGKVIYAVSSVKWGPYRDAQARKDNYWYFGPLRNYATYIFNGYKRNLHWQCKANINYTVPCEGCMNCMQPTKKQDSVRWYQQLLFGSQVNNEPKTINTVCKEIHEKCISTSDFALATTNTLRNFNSLPQLMLNIGPHSVNYIDFVSEGWKTENGYTRNIQETIQAKEIEIKPHAEFDQIESWISIDNEEFELKPVKVTLLPKAMSIFCKKI